MSDTADDADVTTTDPDDRSRRAGAMGKWASALIAVLGLWLIVQAFLVELVASQFWNDVIVGALLLAAGGYNYQRRQQQRLGNMGVATLATLLGLWLLASPFMFGAGTGATEAVNSIGFWNDVVVGLVVLVLGAYSVYQARERRDIRDTVRT